MTGLSRRSVLCTELCTRRGGTSRDRRDGAARARAPATRSSRSPRTQETTCNLRDGRRSAHNPEVVGSNPTPATKSCRSEASSGPGRGLLAAACKTGSKRGRGFDPLAAACATSLTACRPSDAHWSSAFGVLAASSSGLWVSASMVRDQAAGRFRLPCRSLGAGMSSAERLIDWKRLVLPAFQQVLWAVMAMPSRQDPFAEGRTARLAGCSPCRGSRPGQSRARPTGDHSPHRQAQELTRDRSALRLDLAHRALDRPAHQPPLRRRHRRRQRPRRGCCRSCRHLTPI